MKTIILGDTHGRDLWKRIVDEEKADRIIFIGDYFDSFDIDAATQINNFLDICTFKRANPENIVLLIGNHDYHYFPEIGGCGISGYNQGASYTIGHALSGNRDLLQMAYILKGETKLPVLFTHAGVSVQWLEMSYEGWEEDFVDIAEMVNEMWKHKPNMFMFNGKDNYGNDTYQTPIWIRPPALMKANGTFKKDIIQVVGHTRVKEIDIKGKATGGFYYFIDAMDVGQYLVIEDGEFKLGKIKRE